MKTATCRDCGQPIEVSGGRFVKHGACPGWFAKVDDQEGWQLHLESRFTDPRPDCPHPDRWHSRDADSTEYEVSRLVATFVHALRPDLVVETGSAWGQTARAIGDELVDHGHLHTIEVDPDRVAHTRQLCGGLPVTVHEMESMDFVPPGEIGFLWLDSLHHLRVPEFKYFYDWMTSRTIVGFHDTGPHQGALREEIEELEGSLLLAIHLPTPRGVTFAQVIK